MITIRRRTVHTNNPLAQHIGRPPPVPLVLPPISHLGISEAEVADDIERSDESMAMRYSDPPRIVAMHLKAQQRKILEQKKAEERLARSLEREVSGRSLKKQLTKSSHSFATLKRLEKTSLEPLRRKHENRGERKFLLRFSTEAARQSIQQHTTPWRPSGKTPAFPSAEDLLLQPPPAPPLLPIAIAEVEHGPEAAAELAAELAAAATVPVNIREQVSLMLRGFSEAEAYNHTMQVALRRRRRMLDGAQAEHDDDADDDDDDEHEVARKALLMALRGGKVSCSRPEALARAQTRHGQPRSHTDTHHPASRPHHLPRTLLEPSSHPKLSAHRASAYTTLRAPCWLPASASSMRPEGAQRSHRQPCAARGRPLRQVSRTLEQRRVVDMFHRLGCDPDGNVSKESVRTFVLERATSSGLSDELAAVFANDFDDVFEELWEELDVDGDMKVYARAQQQHAQAHASVSDEHPREHAWQHAQSMRFDGRGCSRSCFLHAAPRARGSLLYSPAPAVGDVTGGHCTLLTVAAVHRAPEPQVDFSELYKLLRSGKRMQLRPELREGALGDIGCAAQNAISLRRDKWERRAPSSQLKEVSVLELRHALLSGAAKVCSALAPSPPPSSAAVPAQSSRGCASSSRPSASPQQPHFALHSRASTFCSRTPRLPETLIACETRNACVASLSSLRPPAVMSPWRLLCP